MNRINKGDAWSTAIILKKFAFLKVEKVDIKA